MSVSGRLEGMGCSRRLMGQTRTLDSHAFRLRQKLNRSGDRYVINVWGVGYRLVDGGVQP